VKGIFVVYPEKEYAEEVKASMKAYLASKGVEEVRKHAFIVRYPCCVLNNNIMSPQFEISKGTSQAEIAQKDYFSAVAKQIVENAIYGTLDAAHRYVVSIHTAVYFFFSFFMYFFKCARFEMKPLSGL